MHPNFIQPSKTVAFTGYRPYKITQSDPDNSLLFAEVQARLLTTIHSLANRGFTIFLTGMAEGFDLMAARAVLLAQNTFSHL
ncbi:MAG: hypothetical protein LIO79_02095 [Rikenellaceae bacterium]|nr:hypothetical protein [Rikenellaceae bacterium]